jgi:hypothetical protein
MVLVGVTGVTGCLVEVIEGGGWEVGGLHTGWGEEVWVILDRALAMWGMGFSSRARPVRA